MKTDIQIAQEATMLPIKDVAASIGIEEDDLELYGKYKAKISDELINRTKKNPDGKLILVTAINPTPAGEGKTTTSVGLGEAFGRLGKKALIALREPSLGPCFGIKGGAAGGVGNIHTVAVQLGGQLGIRSLAAACASAGELQIRLSVLHADGIVGKQLRFFGSVHQRIIDLLPIQLAGNGFHGQGLGGTHIGAGGAAGAVQYGHNQGVLIIRSLVLHHGGTLRRGSRFLCIHSNGTNHCMRADHGTQVTLGALGAVPLGYGNGNAPLLKGGRTGRIYAVRPISKGRYR